MKPRRASRSRPREAQFKGSRTRPVGKAQLAPLHGGGEGLARLISRCTTGPRSQYVSAAQYVNALKKDPWLAIGMMRLSRMLMIGDWQIIDLNTKKALDKNAPDPAPVVKLFKQPNQYRDWTMWVNRLMIHWAIMGDAFMVEQIPFVSGAPSELWLLEPDKVEPIPSKTEFLAGYKYRSGGCEVTLSKDIVHQIMWQAHPSDPYRGMGIVEMGETHFNISTSIEEWIWGLFANGAIPDGVITNEDEIDPEELEAMLKQFEERHRGAANSHNPLVLQHGTKYTPGAGPKETDFSIAKEDRSMTSIAMVGVPPIRVGKTKDLNFASATISDSEFIEDTYVPVIRMLEAFFEPITKKFGPYKWIGADRKPITDVTEDRASIVSIVNSGIISLNEGRVMLGMEPKPNEPALEAHYMPFSNAPITGPGVGATVAEDPGAAAGDAPPADKPAAQEDGLERLHDHGHDQKRIGARQMRQARFLIREKNQLEKALERITKAFFNRQSREVIARLLSGKDVKGPGDVLDMTADAARWTLVTRRFFSEALQEEYEATLSFSGARALPGVFAPGRASFDRKLTGLMNGVSRVTEHTRDMLAEVLEEGLTAGLSPTQIAQGTPEFAGIKERFKDFSAHRAQLIARTEADKVLTQAASAAYKDMGVQKVDIVGCEDNVIMPGQTYGCNSRDVPIEALDGIEFHPNHKGVPVAQTPTRRSIRGIEPLRDWVNPIVNRVVRLVVELERELLTGAAIA